eukprot:7306130-Prymnesium_polylepis.2
MVEVERERAKLDDHELHRLRQVREQARQHHLRWRAVQRSVDEPVRRVRRCAVEQVEQPHGETLVRPAAAVRQRERPDAAVRHAPLARLREAAAVLRDARAEHADRERPARLQARGQRPQQRRVALQRERPLQRRGVERIGMRREVQHAAVVSRLLRETAPLDPNKSSYTLAV